MKRPFLFLTIPLIIGILLAYKVILPTGLLVGILMLVSIILVFVVKNSKSFNPVIIVAMIVLGSLITNLQLEKSHLLNFKNIDVRIEGIIKEVISEDDKSSRYELKATKLIFENKECIVNEKLITKVIGQSALELGDEVSIRGTLKEPNENTNPGLFDYKLYLQTQNIFTTLTSKDYNIEVLSKGKLTIPESISHGFIKKIEKVFDGFLKPNHSSIMKSILLGDSSYLDEITEEKFRDLGLAHVLAVSGLHIGIISAFVIFVLSLIGLRRPISIGLTMILIWCYGYMIGYPASVFRASIMFSLLMLANMIYRRYDAVNIIALSAFILLLYNPLSIFSVGFQLSFLATLSLVTFTNRIQNIIFRSKDKVSYVLSPLIAVQIGISPIMIYHFNNISTVTILANLLIVPIISFVLVLGFILIIISIPNLSFFYWIIKGLALIITIILQGVDVVTYMLHKIPFATIDLPSPQVADIFIFYFIVLVLLKIVPIDIFRRYLKPQINRSILVYLYVLIFISLFNIVDNYDKTIIDFIDVGQGDCSLIRTRNKTFLVDCGGTPFGEYDVGENIVLPYLKKRGVTKLDGVFISHFHADHCEGYIPLAKNIRINNLFIGYKKPKDKLFMDVYNSSIDNNVNVRLLRNGDRVYISKDTFIDILSPAYVTDDKYNGNTTIDDNNMSLVMIMTTYGRNVLFTGDIEGRVEDRIVDDLETERDLNKVDINILKAPHHGSNTSSTQEFIDYFIPEFAIIQVGDNNFGHPSRDVVDRYTKSNVEVFRNDINGMISIELNKDTITAYSYLPTRYLVLDLILEYNLQIPVILIFLIVCIYVIKKFSGQWSNEMDGDLNEL